MKSDSLSGFVFQNTVFSNTILTTKIQHARGRKQVFFKSQDEWAVLSHSEREINFLTF